MNPKVEELKKLIAASENVVFFGGAGVSTESGIPDFRSKDGFTDCRWYIASCSSCMWFCR